MAEILSPVFRRLVVALVYKATVWLVAEVVEGGRRNHYDQQKKSQQTDTETEMEQSPLCNHHQYHVLKRKTWNDVILTLTGLHVAQLNLALFVGQVGRGLAEQPALVRGVRDQHEGGEEEEG